MFKRSLPFLALVLLAIEPGSAAGASRLDPSFGDKGFVKAPGTAEWIGDIPAPSNRTAIYPGGRLVVGGHSELGFAVYRYQGNGSLDQDFGKGGVAIVRLPGEEGGSFGSVSAVSVQADGKILAGGLYTPYPVDNCEECEPEYGDPREYSAIVRLDSDGGLDTGFGGSRHGHRHRGMLLLHSKSINDIAVHMDHIFIAGEEVQGVEEFGEAGYVERLPLGGGFGARHVVHLPPSKWQNENSGSSVGGISFDRAGRLYAGGYDRGRFMLARLTRRGEIDRSFGRRGFVRTRAGGRCRCSFGQGIAPDRRGRFLVSGSVRMGHRWAIAVARYTHAGRLDPSFGRNGVVRTHLDADTYGDGIVVRRDGRIVVAGSTANRRAYLGLFTVVRYMPDGRRDRRFFGDGVFKRRFLKQGERAMQPLIDATGKLVVTGETVVARFVELP